MDNTESEQTFRTLAEQSPNMIFINCMGRVVYANERCEAVMGYSRAEFYSKDFDFLILIAPESRELVSANFRRHLNGEDLAPYEYTLITKDDTRIEVIITTKIMSYEGERALLGIITDISDRKRAEAEREALISELETKNSELERFTYTVSHDLKSPLITIKGFLDLLEKDLASGDTAKIESDVSRIGAAADQMEQLLAELLELSRIGRVAGVMEEVRFVELAKEAAAMVEGRRKERKTALKIAETPVSIKGDRTRLREVLENLLDNAIKFMGGQSEPAVEIGVRGDGQQRVFYVRDNGVGIDPQYHQQIFGLFTKLDSASEGSGMGLTIVKRILEMHGGRIWVESEGQGRGSVFCFTLE
jgi:PAS domain S-box-containing protein